MNKVICLISLAGVFALSSCDNANRGIEGNEAENNLMDQRDTSAISEEFNTRGVPAEGIPDNNAVRGDSLNYGNIDNSEVMKNLPQVVVDKIMQDESLRKKRLTDSREFSEGGTTYYELTFDNGAKSTVTFDRNGNRRNQ